MDSLEGIPVEHKLDTFNMPRTGTTLCHPHLMNDPLVSTGTIDLGAMVMKWHSTIPKAPALLVPRHQILFCYIQDTRCGVLPSHTLFENVNKQFTPIP